MVTDSLRSRILKNTRKKSSLFICLQEVMRYFNHEVSRLDEDGGIQGKHRTEFKTSMEPNSRQGWNWIEASMELDSRTALDEIQGKHETGFNASMGLDSRQAWN